MHDCSWTIRNAREGKARKAKCTSTVPRVFACWLADLNRRLHYNQPMETRVYILFAGLVLVTSAAQAHHSIAAMYDEQREITLDVTVKEFRFINPHPYVLVAATVNGEIQEWKLEMDNRFEMSDIGMTQESLKPGDRLRITGNPANDLKRSLYIRKLQRPADGYAYEQVGFSPRLVSTAR